MKKNFSLFFCFYFFSSFSFLFLLISFLFSSCHLQKDSSEMNDFELFKAVVYLKLLPAQKVEILKDEAIGLKGPILSPPATWQMLMRFRSLRAEDVKLQDYCLNYLVPFMKEKEQGVLRLEEVDKDGPCHPGQEKKIISELSSIHNLSFFLSEEKQYLKERKMNILPYVLYLNFDYDFKNTWLSFPLLNISKESFFSPAREEMKKTSSGYKRYSTPFIDRFFRGAMFYSPVLNEESSIKNKFCYKKTEDCSDSIIDLCDECENSWFELVGRSCSGGYARVCGERHCGGYDQPACPRGHIFNQLTNGCFEGSNAGFCQEGLHTYCNEEKILICK